MLSLALGNMFWWRSLAVLVLLAALCRKLPRLQPPNTTALLLLAFFLPIVVRVLLLPVLSVPVPIVTDEFAYLFGADTFAAGRLTNPPPPLKEFFAAPHLLMEPTFASRYQPGQAAMLALGQVGFGEPWAGVVLSCGLMSLVVTWALLAWLPPGWAALGGLFTALGPGLAGYWMDSYWGGSLAAACAALLLGAWRRGNGFLVGLALWGLFNTRPFEGALIAAPCVAAFIWQQWKARRAAVALVPMCAMLLLGGTANGIYNQAVTGSPWRMPYLEYARQHNYAPFFVFESPKEKPRYLSYSLAKLHEWEETESRMYRSPAGLWKRVKELAVTWRFLLGGDLLAIPLVLGFPLVFRDRRTRLVACTAAFALLLVQASTFHFAHYWAPFLPTLVLLNVQALRHFRWTFRRQRLVPALLAASLALSVGVEISHIPWQAALRNSIDLRARLVARLEATVPQQHLVFVRYDPQAPSTYVDWAYVYNRANWRTANVVFAHDRGLEENRKLIDLLPGRRVWLLPAHEKPGELRPYTGPKESPTP